MDEEFGSLDHQKAMLLVEVIRKGLEGREITKALEFASEKHREQKRKNGKPFIIHPIRVARCVLENGGTKEEVIAAILHDVVEDSDAKIEEIEEMFGEKVRELVLGLTKEKGESIEDYLERVEKAKAGLVKACDALDNLKDMEGVLERGEKEWIKRHLKEYEMVIERFGNESIREEAKKVVEKLRKVVES